MTKQDQAKLLEPIETHSDVLHDRSMDLEWDDWESYSDDGNYVWFWPLAPAKTLSAPLGAMARGLWSLFLRAPKA